MEDTGHYHFALLKYLLDRHYTVALINPTTTDLTRKLQGGITKNAPLILLPFVMSLALINVKSLIALEK